MPSTSERPARVGDVAMGPSATVDAYGSVRRLGEANAEVSVQWWVGSEERWHVPSLEASCRQARVDAMPVLETVLKVPGGDARSHAYAAVLAGGVRRGVVLEVQNASAVPFAVGWVVVSDSPMTTDGSSVWVDGTEVLSLPRPAARFGWAASPDALLSSLDAEQFIDRFIGEVRGALALVVPVPHTATVVALVDPRTPRRTRRRREVAPTEPWDRSAVPSAAQVASGWRSLVSRGARFEWADKSVAATFDAARAELLMGPVPTADAIELAAVIAACARLSWIDEVDGFLEALLDCQKLDGRVDSIDPPEATRRLLDACSALWVAGLSPSAFEPLVGPIAKAGHWLARGRRAPRLSPTGATALRSIVPVLRSIGQPDVADDFESFAGAVAQPSTEGLPLTPDAATSELTCAADLVVAGVESMVRETPDGIDLFTGWKPTGLGSSLEAHEVATRWGTVSVALRWHGGRPALLWELSPYDERSDVAGSPPIWRASSLDAGWSSEAPSADALLAPSPAN